MDEAAKTPETYNSLARIYDDVMACVNYDAWFDLILDICKENKLDKSAKILEIGAGTGVLGKKLTDFGFSCYHGSDLSLDMARAAKQKGLDFVCADCRNLPFNYKFDLIFFLFDGINYLFEMSDFAQTFAQVHEILRNRGLFLFDITTQENSVENFLSYREAVAGGDFAYIRDSYYEKNTRLQHNDFEIFIETQNGLYRRFSEKHTQKVHSVKSVLAAIPQDLFEAVEVFGSFDRKKYTKNSKRVHFLLRKK